MGFRNSVRGHRPGEHEQLRADVDAAQADATIARDVAERAIRCFAGNLTPEAEGEGDLWLQPVVAADGDTYHLIHRAAAAGSASWAPVAIMADRVRAGAVDGQTITGPWIRTGDTGARVELGNPYGADIAFWFTGAAGETPDQAGRIYPDVDGAGRRILALWGPHPNVGGFGQIYLLSADPADPTGTPTEIVLGADRAVVDVFAGGRFTVRENIGGLPTAFAVDTAAKTVDTGTGYQLGATLAGRVDARVSSVAPTVTMTSGSVGTGAFRDTVDARVSSVAPTVTMTSGSVGTGAFRDTVRSAFGRRIDGWQYGTATTDTAGQATVSHGLGVTPSAVVVTPRGGAGQVPGVNARNATTFSVDIIHRSGTRSAVTFDWWALQGPA